MAIDPQDGYPDDWVRPALAPLDDGYPDDWFVPPSAQGAGFPDDWVGPVSAPSASQAAPGPQPGAMACARPNPPASDSFAAFLPFMPATQAAISGWGQRITGDAFGQSALQQVWPPAFSPAVGAFGSLASPQSATNAPPFTSSSLFGGNTTPRPEASPYNMLFGGVTTPNYGSDADPHSSLGAEAPASDTSQGTLQAPNQATYRSGTKAYSDNGQSGDGASATKVAYSQDQSSAPEVLDTSLREIEALDQRRVVNGNYATSGIQSGTVRTDDQGNWIVSNGVIISKMIMEDQPTVIVTTVEGPHTATVDRVTGAVTLNNP